jgi:hypothetical protein
MKRLPRTGRAHDPHEWWHYLHRLHLISDRFLHRRCQAHDARLGLTPAERNRHPAPGPGTAPGPEGGRP